MNEETEVLDPEPEALPLSEDELADLYLPQARREFQVTDEDSANWVVGQILNCDAEEARIKAQMENALREVRRRREFFVNRYEWQLSCFAQERIVQDGAKSKSIKLPNGTIGFRKIKAGIKVVEESKLIAWAYQFCPQAIRASLLKTPINEMFQATGELPDGTVFAPEKEVFGISKPRGIK